MNVEKKGNENKYKVFELPPSGPIYNGPVKREFIATQNKIYNNQKGV